MKRNAARWSRGIVRSQTIHNVDRYYRGLTQGGLGVAYVRKEGYSVIHLGSGCTISPDTMGISTQREALLVAEQLLMLEGLWETTGGELAKKLCDPDVEGYITKRLQRIGLKRARYATTYMKNYKE